MLLLRQLRYDPSFRLTDAGITREVGRLHLG